MFTGEPTPPRETIASANAYLGAFAIAEALNQGADIVVTGRCVDSAVTLGACIHRFGWQRNDLDLLAAGSLAGHLIECGPQATGGNYTDWHEVADSLHEVGYPIAEIAADGAVLGVEVQAWDWANASQTRMKVFFSGDDTDETDFGLYDIVTLTETDLQVTGGYTDSYTVENADGTYTEVSEEITETLTFARVDDE